MKIINLSSSPVRSQSVPPVSNYYNEAAETPEILFQHQMVSALAARAPDQRSPSRSLSLMISPSLARSPTGEKYFVTKHHNEIFAA